MSDSPCRPAQSQNDKRTYQPPTIEAVKLNTKEVLLGDCENTASSAEGLACGTLACESLLP